MRFSDWIKNLPVETAKSYRPISRTMVWTSTWTIRFRILLRLRLPMSSICILFSREK